MKKSQLILGILLGALLASGLFAYLGKQQLSSSSAGSSQQRELSIAHTLPTSHPVHQGIERFAKRLEALSGGQMTCTIYPSGQLGSETQYLEKLQSGSIDIAKTSAGPIANFVPRMQVFSLPYLFRDREHYWKVLDGEVGQGMLDKLADRGEGKPSGIQGICFYDAGSRNFYTKEPVTKPEDLKGMTIRVMKDPVAISMMETFGSTPKPMPGGEIYSALQRGNIQGAENNPPTFMKDSHWEVCKHFTFDHHSRIPDVLSMSSKTWNKLTDQEKEWIKTAARESSLFQRQLWQEQSDLATEAMKEKGVTIHRPDPALFEKAASATSSQFMKGEVKTLAEQIKSTQ
ncbi:solute-binding protein Bamb_6123 [Rubritalea halochordaticola]|uniref:Solute-binding protein Bamb_6123 n=1 Tax=Rubritalea halochordaticola TaxID=714537 RepID=A0ABP9V427_9BACT